MRVLVKKLKLKRFVAMLLLVCMVMSTFITSIGVVDVHASSNDRRTALINIGGGQTLSSVDATTNIDEASLQVLALYLSNYYIPFVTILDGDYNYEDAEDTGNKAHVQAMQNALTSNCGMAKNTAEFVTNYLLSQSLGTCTPIYVSVLALSNVFGRSISDKTENWITFAGVSYPKTFTLDTNSKTGEITSKLSDWKHGDTKLYYKRNGAGSTTSEKVKYYIDYFGSVTDSKGRTFVPVSYPIFLAIMQDSVDNVRNQYKFSVKGWSRGDHLFDEPKRTPFYCRDTANNFKVCFSNSVACLESFLSATSEVNAKKGYGTSFSFVGEEDVEAIDCVKDSMKAMAFGSQMYVNWEGSLIVDTGAYRTPVVPGCSNPHMLTKVEDTGDCYTVPLQNLFAMASYINGYSKGNNLAIKVTDSLYDTETWRVEAGNSEDDFDGGGINNWGNYQYIHDLISASSMTRADTGSNQGDHITFPNFSYLSEITYDKRGSGDKEEIVPTGYRRFLEKFDGYGSPHLNSDLVFFAGSFMGVTTETELHEMFPRIPINDKKFLDEFSVSSMDIYASFRTVTKLGTEGVYNSVPTDLARCLYWTYCFAKFNEGKTTFDESDCIVDLKLNTSIFPTFNSNIDWSTLYADSLSDQVLSFTYYLLHPTEGIGYVATLLRNKIGGFLLRWHDDIVGSSDSNSSTGMTKYLGTSSYTTTSGLYDVKWIAKILDSYNDMIVYFIVVICLVMLCYILTGTMTVQRGVVGVILFALLAFLPPVAINATTNIINTVSDKVYSKKFDYWAVTQLENYLLTLDKATSSRDDKTNFSSYAAFVISQYTNASDSVGGSVATGYGGAKLKWMSPKKYSSMAMVSSAMNSITESTDAKFLVQSLFSSLAQATSGETYLDSDNALYLYRDYTDIYRAGANSYYVENIYNYNGYLKSGANSEVGVSTHKPLVLFTKSNDSNRSNYYTAWNNIPNVNDDLRSLVFKDTRQKTSDILTDDDCYSVASSTHAAKLGFLVDTTSYITNETYYLHGVGISNNSFAISYLLNYNHMYRYISTALDALQKVEDGSKKVKLDSLPSADRIKRGDNYFNFGSYFGDKNENFYLYGTPQILGLTEQRIGTSGDGYTAANAFTQLSSYFYGLYSESPFYFFSNNIRDQITQLKSYKFNPDKLSNAKGDGMLNLLAEMMLSTNQDYFFNVNDNAGQGYGELRDFMNMHDLFYYVIPVLRDGTELARLYDDLFGLYMNDDIPLQFTAEGTFTYEGNSYGSLDDFRSVYNGFDEEHKYKFWHSYNTFTILQNYTAWLDTMMDCSYADAEMIHVMGDKFLVEDPLNPFSYFKKDSSNKITEGRLMVFSRSEMAYYGLNESDLTSVERKIIQLQDNVYEKTLDLMNYYTLSDETLITSYALIQLFEFNTIFSQPSLVGESFIMYPQGYELKAFSYDSYLRLIIAEASGEPIMTGASKEEGLGTTEDNSSIYKRVLENTSLFFAIFLLINDVLAVYLIPGLKLFFIVCIFFTSVALIVASVVKLEMNMMKVMWKSLLAPLLSFAGVSIGMSLLVSMFMGDGANGVVSSSAVIDLGDPTAAIIVMIIVNAGAVILYFKICKKCFHDLKTYFKAVFDNIGATAVGAIGTLAGALTNGRAMDRLLGRGSGSSNVAKTAKQRGRDNSPTSGKNGIGVGAGGAAALGAGLSKSEAQQHNLDNTRKDESVGMNKYDKKAYDAANKRSDEALAKAERTEKLANNSAGLKKKGLQMASDLQMKRAMRADSYANDVAKYGKVGALKNQFKNDMSSAGKLGASAAGKVKSGAGRLKSGAISTARNAKNVVTNIDNYAKAGEAVAKVANAPRALVTKAKKGTISAIETAQIKGMYAMDAVRNAPGNVIRGARSAVETVQIKGMYALDKGKAGLRKARSYGETAADGARRAKKAFDSGYGFTRNR